MTRLWLFAVTVDEWTRRGLASAYALLLAVLAIMLMIWALAQV